MIKYLKYKIIVQSMSQSFKEENLTDDHKNTPEII